MSADSTNPSSNRDGATLININRCYRAIMTPAVKIATLVRNTYFLESSIGSLDGLSMSATRAIHVTDGSPSESTTAETSFQRVCFARGFFFLSSTPEFRYSHRNVDRRRAERDDIFFVHLSVLCIITQYQVHV